MPASLKRKRLRARHFQEEIVSAPMKPRKRLVLNFPVITSLGANDDTSAMQPVKKPRIVSKPRIVDEPPVDDVASQRIAVALAAVSMIFVGVSVFMV